MASVNKVILVGHLGRDPEIRRLSDGKRVANFSIATSETWKDKNTGERKEKSEWHRVSVFNDGIAGIVEKYLTKGSKVYVEGALQTRKWTDKDGVEKYTTEIVIQAFNGNLVLLDKNTSEGSQIAQDGDNYSEQVYKPKFNHPGSTLNSGAMRGILNDEIPFMLDRS